MLFDNITKNKVTEFTCRHGDKVCKITYEYDIESLQDCVDAFETIMEFLTYPKGTLEAYYGESDN